MSIKTAREYIEDFNMRNRPKQKPRIPVKKQLLKQKMEIRRGLLEELRRKRRELPKEWLRGFDSAVSSVDIYLEE